MFACTLEECPPGLFLYDGTLGFKSEYRTDRGQIEVFVVASGECFWGGAKSADERSALLVYPVEVVDAQSLRFADISHLEDE